MVKTMIIIADYTLVGKPDSDVCLIIPHGQTPPCPCCGGPLYYRDSRERIMKHEGGEKTTLIIRRLRNARKERNLNPELKEMDISTDKKAVSGLIKSVNVAVD